MTGCSRSSLAKELGKSVYLKKKYIRLNERWQTGSKLIGRSTSSSLVKVAEPILQKQHN